MPKLNVQQTNQNVIQAFKNALAIGNLKGIIASDGSHNFSTAGSNRNLLDNPWFTVNQRNFTTSTGVNNFYSVDRWYIARGTGTISKTSNGITINGVGASRETTFQQMIDCGDLTGRTVTLSVNDGGTIRQMAGEVPARTTSNNIFIRFTLRDGVSAFLYAMATSSAYAYMLQLQVNAGYTLDLRAVKLELGSVSTLANDAPPEYANEILKCEHRCVVYNLPTNTLLCRGIATSTTNIAGVLDLPRDMAEDKTPTVSITGSLTTPAGNTITAIAAATYARKNKLRVNFTGSGFTSGTVYDIFTGSASPTITISADL